MDFIKTRLWGCGAICRACWLLAAVGACTAIPSRRPAALLHSGSADLGHLAEYNSQVSGDLLEDDATPLQPGEPESDNLESDILHAGRRTGVFETARDFLAEARHGHFVNALSAPWALLSEEHAADADSGAAQSAGILLVFVVLTSCWITELILAKLWDPRAEDSPQDGVDIGTRPFLHALSFARYLIAWHVVLDHFAYGGERGATQTSMDGEPWAVFARWGALAAPWFFMMSGFSNSYSKLVGPQEQRHKEEDFIHAMLQRVFSWYPFFLIALTWCALRLASSDAEDWGHFTAHTMFIHRLLWKEPSFPFLIGDEWLSWFIPYLLTWAPMHQALSEGTQGARESFVWTVFYASFFIAVPSAILEWYFVSVPIFSMMQLWPSFVFGQALAFWFVRNCLEEQGVPVETGAGIEGTVWVKRNVVDIPVLVRFGATIGVLVSGVVFFSYSPYDLVPLFNQPALPLVQKGFQLPLQGLMMVGFAAEIDPLAKLFARRPFRFAEKLALMTFLFQGPVHRTIHDITGLAGMTWTFVGTLIAFTIVAHYALEQPYRKWRGARARGESWQENGAFKK